MTNTLPNNSIQLSGRPKTGEGSARPDGRACQESSRLRITGEKILDAADKVASKHISQVQKIVQKKLEALETN